QLLFDNGLFWDCPQRLANLFLQFTNFKQALYNSDINKYFAHKESENFGNSMVPGPHGEGP
ncbi:hypothetical protein, partial [Lacticaseibacillus casei]